MQEELPLLAGGLGLRVRRLASEPKVYSATRWSSSAPNPKWKSAPSGSATSAPEEGPDAHRRHAADDLPGQEPERVHVVAVGRPGLPPRLLRRERAGHPVPVVDRLVWQAGAGPQAVPHGGRAACEPSPRPSRLPRTRASSAPRGRRGRPRRAPPGAGRTAPPSPCRRRRPRRGCRAPTAASSRVPPPGPDVDDRLSIHGDRHGGAELAVVAEVGSPSTRPRCRRPAVRPRRSPRQRRAHRGGGSCPPGRP